MDEILSQGGDREPGRWSRRLAAVVVLVVLVVVTAGHLPHGQVVPAHAAAAVTAGPVQLAGLGSGAAGLLDEAGRDHRVGRSKRRRPSAACHRGAACLDLVGQMQRGQPAACLCVHL
jgi:hypothetical protein